jgi:iron complex outermembrane receptor protein
MRAFLLFIIVVILGQQALWSQTECGQIALEKGQKCFETGRFDELVSLIAPCLEEGFTKDEQIQAYRLLALSHMAIDDIDAARKMIEEILKLDPFYTSNLMFDPPRYVQLIESMRKPVTSLVTASRLVEPVNESPVPVVVITEEMITGSGARNLKELLYLFVPGMTAVDDQNELNIAMRGVYGSSQQKILVMLDGHRLNSRAYSEANPDFSLSLDKIKQIEVLRGPASSLYGNVALTSVINIIPKKGSDVSGAKLIAGTGNYGQIKASMLYGKQFDRDNDILLWGNYYRSEGEERFIPAEEDYSPNPVDGYAYLGAFKDKPAFDVGMAFHSRNLSVLGNVRHAKYVDPFTSGGLTGETYKYDTYRTILGTGPGLSSGSAHMDARYSWELSKGWDLNLNCTFDFNQIVGTLVTNPYKEGSGRVNWNENGFGGTLQARKTYQLKRAGKGNLLAGIQVDGMKLYDSFYLIGTSGEYDTTGDSKEKPLLEEGTESIYSGFVQLKHRFGEKWILNIGGRYDYKLRHKGGDLENFSPRMSLIFLPARTVSMKISYASSFVDAPYWYRYNSLPSYKGSENLQPEHLTSLQYTFGYTSPKGIFELEGNVFYNHLRDFIFRDLEATGDEPRYRNAGQLESVGTEGKINFLTKPVRIRSVVTWQYALNAEDYGVTGHRIHNIPEFAGSLLVDVHPFHRRFEPFLFNVTFRYIGYQLSPIINTYKNGQPIQLPENGVDEALIVNAGIRLADFHRFTADFRIYNLFGAEYYQGGSVVFPYPQQGRWWMVEVGIGF